MVTFTGKSTLIRALDDAVSLGEVHRITEAVKQALMRLVAERALDLPERFRKPVEGTYARRLLHRSLEYGYTALAMVWAPGQGTALHDHSGMWCVEGVLEGELEVVQYELLEKKNGLYYFAPKESVFAGVGSAGSLIPPFEYHTITNRDPSRLAITLHVYGGEMDHCNIFEPVEGGGYRLLVKQLSYHD